MGMCGRRGPWSAGRGCVSVPDLLLWATSLRPRRQSQPPPRAIFPTTRWRCLVKPRNPEEKPTFVFRGKRMESKPGLVLWGLSRRGSRQGARCHLQLWAPQWTECPRESRGHCVRTEWPPRAALGLPQGMDTAEEVVAPPWGRPVWWCPGREAKPRVGGGLTTQDTGSGGPGVQEQPRGWRLCTREVRV